MRHKFGLGRDRKSRVFQYAAIFMMVGCSAPSAARTELLSTYECANGKAFIVSRDKDFATVDFEEQSYRLARQSSSMGIRYSSGDASLIIDGTLAVFATNSVFDLRMCNAARG